MRGHGGCDEGSLARVCARGTQGPEVELVRDGRDSGEGAERSQDEEGDGDEEGEGEENV